MRSMSVQALPRQNNSYDCGLYMLAYAQYLSHKPPHYVLQHLVNASPANRGGWNPYLFTSTWLDVEQVRTTLSEGRGVAAIGNMLLAGQHSM